MNNRVILFLLGTVFAAILLASVILSRDAASTVLRSLFDAETYASNLSKGGKVGCNTAFYWQPDVFFVGDSHTGSGWDFAFVHRNTGMRIGACIWGGAIISELSKLAEVFAQTTNYTPTIVIGISPRQFWEGENLEARVNQTGESLETMQQNRNFWGHVLPRILIFDPMKPGSDQRRFANYDKFRSIMEPPLQDMITATIHQWNPQSLTKWRDRVTSASALPDIHRSLDTLCTVQRSGDAELVVVYIWESPALWEIYDQSSLRPMREALAYLEQCGVSVLPLSENNPMTNAHFLDLYGLDAVKESLSGNDVSLPSSFDADHMNVIGARVMTEWFLSSPSVKSLLDANPE